LCEGLIAPSRGRLGLLPAEGNAGIAKDEVAALRYLALSCDQRQLLLPVDDK
jgi:hypothetical protein